ncbi:hypothetical protein [Actinomadura formosensis]|uniref:hypothetical protein n=1 Tax=Actinomadura formosensis TaxID=60706 RepID=UPI0008349CA8|nr:hypothetical protein [Actinomadura formosensis]
MGTPRRLVRRRDRPPRPASETDLDNSALLQPIGDAPFTLVNRARWDHVLARFAVHQFTKPSFLMPVLYKLA